ncbi:mechanosensitive ion channel family protein [Lysobacter sp. A3-1-A15]|uniref:mechanosensitive ion channel family protein n=1 Tax=Novilysobacter viscosus TaxID=3098602 RepID=UPI002ED7A119
MDTPPPRFDLQAVAEQLYEETYRLLAALPMLGVAVAVLVLAWLVGGWLSRRTFMDRVARQNPFMRELARTTVRWATFLVGMLLALELLNATAMVGAVLGTAGVLGVAVGFAFKDILENYLAGILLSLRQPFAPRDHVVIDGHEGLVVKLTSRATVLMTLEGNHLRLPNGLVFRGVILNYSRNPSRRFEFEVGLGVQEDLVQAQDIGLSYMAALPGVIDEPPPRAFISTLGDSDVRIRYQGWVDQRSHDFFQVKSEAIRSVKLALDEAGMDMPEPMYRVQLSEPRAASTRESPAQPSPASKRPAQPVAPGSAVAADRTNANRDIEAQIEREPMAEADSNLLDPTAPRE